MAIETAATVQESCSRCGSPHRPSYFDRACRCPVCGQPLHGPLQREPFRIPRVPLAIGTAVLLGVGITSLATRALNERRSPVSTSLAAPRPDSSPVPAAGSLRLVELDSQLGAVLQEKARVLQADLSSGSPDAPVVEPMLVVALAETRLYQALLSRDADHDEKASRRALDQARALLQRLTRRRSFLAAPLRYRVDRFSELQLRNEPAGSLAARLWPIDSGRDIIFPPTLTAGDMGGFSNGGVVVMGGPGMAGGPPLTVSPPPFGTRRQPPPAFPPAGGGGTPSGGAVPGSPPPRFLPQAGGSAGLPPASVQLPPEVARVTPDQALASARAEFAAHPGNPGAVERLGRLLTPPGPRRRRGQPSELEDPQRVARLKEAVRVYRTAAEKARLRVFRAGFYHAASRIYQRLEEWEKQHEVLKLATQAAPFSSELWNELGESALRTANLEESQLAETMARKRRLPAMRLIVAPSPAQTVNPFQGSPGYPPPATADAPK